MRIRQYYFLYIFLLAGIFGSPLLAVAQNSGKAADTPTKKNSCSDSGIDFSRSGKPLTNSEKIARMDKAFYASLNKFDRCQTAPDSTRTSSSNSSSSSSNDSGSNNVGTAVRGTDGLSKESAAGNAATAISGAMPPPQVKNQSQPSQKAQNGAAGTPTGQILANGRAPADIPPGDNDSILEAQIRAAAMAEADPVRKKLLWNEYRRYKGLKPIKNNKGR